MRFGGDAGVKAVRPFFLGSIVGWIGVQTIFALIGIIIGA